MRTFEAFASNLASPSEIINLFDFLPRVYLYIKNAQSRFVKANQPFAKLHGFLTPSDVFGKNDFDFHPPALAAQYVEEDQRVMNSGDPLPNQIWLVMGSDHMPRWYVSTKIPLRAKNGEMAGIAGVMRLYEHAGPAPTDYFRLTPAMEFVHQHFGERIAIQELACLTSLSVSQLQREFKRLFEMSPSDYIQKVRLLMARRMLEQTGDAIGSIALDCGFYDQSHFTKIFRAEMGMPPMEYRKQFSLLP